MKKELDSFETLCWAKTHGELPSNREQQFDTGLKSIPGAQACLTNVETIHQILLASGQTTDIDVEDDVLIDIILRQIDADSQIRPQAIPQDQPDTLPATDIQDSTAPRRGFIETAPMEEADSTPHRRIRFPGPELLGIAAALAASLLLFLTLRETPPAPVVYRGPLKSSVSTTGEPVEVKSEMNPALRAACNQVHQRLLTAIDPVPDCVFFERADGSATLEVTINGITLHSTIEPPEEGGEVHMDAPPERRTKDADK